MHVTLTEQQTSTDFQPSQQRFYMKLPFTRRPDADNAALQQVLRFRVQLFQLLTVPQLALKTKHTIDAPRRNDLTKSM
jgi:hypothetical protein